MDERQFEIRAQDLLQQVTRALEDASDDIDIEMNSGVLTVELEDGRTFVVNKHAPMKQIWLSSPISGASHYAYDHANDCWQSTRDARELTLALIDDFAQAGVELALTVS